MLWGERFIREGATGWLDLSTGWPVDLRPYYVVSVDRADERAAFLEAWCASPCASTILDVFTMGDGRWWAAHHPREIARGGGLERAADVVRARSLVRAISDANWIGVRVLCPTDSSLIDDPEAPGCSGRVRLISMVAHYLRDAGFVTIRPSLPVPRDVRRELTRRHLAFAVLEEADASSLAHELERAVRVSPRGHLVIDIRPRADRAANLAVVRERSPSPGGRGTTVALGAPVRSWALAPSPRTVSGEKTMIVEAIPRLLELANEAEDERAALKRSCAWARTQRGITAAGFYTVAAARPIATDGIPFSGCESAAASVLSAPTATVLAFDGQIVASEPVRYSGVRIGSVVARGLEEESTGIRQAVSTLAAIGAPALRACADVEIAAARDDSGLADDILGQSPAMRSVRETIARVAPAPFAVLVEGASGTGKELAARAIHRLSPRRDRRFSAVNCAALTDELVEAELFGHSRGAFTGAVAARAGLFEDAHLGTVFLDEVGELSPRAQAKLLRVLQEREVKRVGENLTRPVDVRVIAATNRPLADAVARGLFRDDLLFRIAVVRLRLPPLGDRLEDLPQLALSVWRRAIRDVGKSAALGADAIGALCRHRWPGNVRELQNVIAAMAVLAPVRGRVHARHVHAVLGQASAADRADEVMSLVEARRLSDRRTIAAALARHGGRQSAAARELGLSRQGLAKAMRRIGLRPARTIDVA